MLLKVVYNFVILNVCVILPLAGLLLFRMPQNYSVLTDERSRASLVLGLYDKASADYKFTRQLRPRARLTEVAFREFFPSSAPLDSAALLINSVSSGEFCIRGLRMTHFDLISRYMTPSDIEQSFVLTDQSHFERRDGLLYVVMPHGRCKMLPKNERSWSGLEVGLAGNILPRQTGLAVFGCETILILFSLVGALFIDLRMKFRERLAYSLGVASLMAFFTLVVIPVQTYWSNPSVYDFSWWNLSKDLAVPFCIVFITLAVGLFASTYGFGTVWHVLILAFLLYEYLQTGFLAMDEPSFNGDMAYYDDMQWGIRDLLILLSLLFSATVLYRWIKSFLPWMLVGFGVIYVAMLFDVRKGAKDEISVPGVCSRESVATHTVFSTKTNLLVFVVDSCTVEAVNDVLTAHEDLKSSLAGFTCYNKNLGMHHETDIATVGMLTGRYYRNRADKRLVNEFLACSFDERSLLTLATNHGWRVSFLPSAYRFGLTYPMSADVRQSFWNGKNVFYSQPDDSFALSLFDFTRFRLMPFIGKTKIYSLSVAGSENRIRVDDEDALYPLLAQAATTDSEPPLFAFYHTHGAHIPHRIDAQGLRMSLDRSGYDAYLDHTYFVMKELAALFGRLEEVGVYDKSTILVVADHGSHCETDTRLVSQLPPRAYPVMLVKAAGDRAAFSFDNITPTTHAKIYELLSKSLTKSLSAGEIKEVLKCEESRLFVMPDRNGYREVSVDSCNQIVSDKHIILD